MVAAVGALVLAAPAGAHVDATPTGIPAGGAETVSLVAHNDRKVPMDELLVSGSAGLAVTEASDAEGWVASVEDGVARWAQGSLAGDANATFELDVAGPEEPGPATLSVEQRYPDGGIVRSQVTLTVVPGEGADNGSTVFLVVLVALVLGTAGVALAVRRRRGAGRN